MPIIFISFTEAHLLKIRHALLRGLMVGSLVSLISLLGINLYHYFEGQDYFHFGLDLFNYYHTYHKFTLPLEQHPTYLGIYYLTALIFIGDIVGQKKVQYFLIILFGVGFLFLNSRVVFLAILILLGYRGFQWIRKLILNKEFSRLLFLFLGFGLLIFFFAKFISQSYIGLRLKNIYRFEISTESEESFNSRSKSNPRMARYVSALKVIQEKPFFGHGTADEYPNLKKQFEKDGLQYAAQQNYNSHNLYIGYAIRFGFFGVLVLIFFIIANANLALREKEFDYFLFILIIACVNLVENYFDRNFGITFSALMFTIMSYQLLLKRESN